MRTIIQRVNWSKVRVDDSILGQIQRGLMVLLGIARADTRSDADYLVEKLTSLRIFPDDEGRMNRSAAEIGAGVLIVPNFTIYGDCTRGRRPGFDLAAPPAEAKELYDYFVSRAQDSGLPVAAGKFQAHMKVELEIDGPVTLICDSR